MAVVTLPWTEAPGQPNNVNHVMANDQALRDGVNSVDGVNLSSALAARVAATQGATVRAGKSNIATVETRSSASYGVLPTPDRVAGIVHPADGLLKIGFTALWHRASGDASATAKAAIFIGGNQLKFGTTQAGAPGVQEAVIDSGTAGAGSGFYVPLYITPTGLNSPNDTGGSDSTLVTTGQILGGGRTEVWLAAGTYDVEIRYLTSNASVLTVKERKLWVETKAFVN